MKLRLSAGFDLSGGGGDVWRDNFGRFEVVGLTDGITESIVSDFWSWDCGAGWGSCDVCPVEVGVFEQGSLAWWWRRDGKTSMMNGCLVSRKEMCK